MCPACLSALLLTAGGTGSAGGLIALAVKKLKSRAKPATRVPPQPSSRPQTPSQPQGKTP